MGVTADDFEHFSRSVHKNDTVPLVGVQFHGVTLSDQAVGTFPEINGVLSNEDFTYSGCPHQFSPPSSRISHKAWVPVASTQTDFEIRKTNFSSSIGDFKLRLANAETVSFCETTESRLAGGGIARVQI